MIPLTTIQQSIEQARKASLALRRLLRHNLAPSAQDVRECMERGAQIQWMSTKGSHAAEHAVLIALSKGYVDAVEVMLEYSGPVAAPRGQSLFAVALGERSAPTHPDDYRRCVNALIKHGCSVKDEEAVQYPALRSAFERRHLLHAEMLLSSGAVELMEDRDFVMAILHSAMDHPDSIDLLLRFCPLDQFEVIAKHWWEAAEKKPRSSTAIEKIVSHGLQSAPPDVSTAIHLLDGSPGILASMLRQGFELPAMYALNSWDDQSMEPAWRQKPENVHHLLDAGTPASSLNLATNESRNGLNWLSYMVKEEHVVDSQKWRAKESLAGVFANVLPHAIAAGLDVASPDRDGITAGLHIINSLMEQRNNPEKSSDNNTREWLELVVEFELLVGTDASLRAVSSGPIASFLASHGLLDRIKAQVDHRTLTLECPIPPARPRPNRRI